ncbi:MAG: DNA polymerase III subunit beta [Anaerofustis stercorihominis]|nr:DNA polymerase III subunit beta [Anaerofustis stercorihominis]
MKFSVNASELNKALAVVSKAISPKSALPILECVYIKADSKEHKIFLKGSDGDFSIITKVPAIVYIEGEIVVQVKKLVDIVRTYSEGNIEFFVDEKNVINFSCDFAAISSDVTLLGRNANEYPPIVTYEQGDIRLDSNMMKSLIKETVFACAVNEAGAPILTGILIEIKDGLVKFSALDGFKMAIRKENIDNTEIELKCVVPAKTMSEVLRIIGIYEYDVFIGLHDKKIVFDIGTDTQVVSNLLMGDFINCEALIPKDINTVVKLDRTELMKSVDRCALINDSINSSMVKMDFVEENLKIYSRSSIGHIVEEMRSTKSGEDVFIAFNSRYLLEILKNLSDERIVLEIKNRTNPALIKPVDNDKYLYLIMPVKYVD